MPAAGSGQRMGGARKPLLKLGDRSVLAWALSPFLDRSDVVQIVVALSAGECLPADVLASDGRVQSVQGGDTRFRSVANALAALGPEVDVVVVHDGARPFPAPEMIAECIALAAAGGGAIAGVPAVDAIKRADTNGLVTGSPERQGLWYAQTPQAFPRIAFADAVRGWPAEGEAPTDDSMLMERIGHPVRLVASSTRNLKVTHPADMLMAEVLIREGLV